MVLHPAWFSSEPQVVVEGEQHGAGALRSSTEPDRRLPAVRPDLEERRIGDGLGRLGGGLPQGIALVRRHEAAGGDGGGVELGGHVGCGHGEPP
ncbi:MAG: hypothetical protein R2711_07185 [Acidimicrobiales bacterium]